MVSARGRHREPKQGHNWGMVIVWVVCLGVLGSALLIMIGGWANLFTADVTPQSLPEQHQVHAPTTPAEPVSKPVGRKAVTAEEVLRDTQFVQEYKRDQRAIATGHSDKGLAMHGIDICNRVADRKHTVTDMVRVFMEDYHNHPGPVTAQAAKQTFALALQDICPDLTDEWKAKPAL